MRIGEPHFPLELKKFCFSENQNQNNGNESFVPFSSECKKHDKVYTRWAMNWLQIAQADKQLTIGKADKQSTPTIREFLMLVDSGR